MPKMREPFSYVPEPPLRPRLSLPRRRGGYRDELMRLLLTEIESGSSMTKLYATLLAKELLAAPLHHDRRFRHVVDERYRDLLQEVLRREGLGVNGRERNQRDLAI
jgi:hypothetical protein